MPQVATAWRNLDDTTIEFDIREGVTLPGRHAADAEDVVFSIRRIIRPELQEPAAVPVRPDRLGRGRRARTRWCVKTKTPYPVLLAQLVKLSIVPKAYVEKVGDQRFNQEPMGSGPYRLQELAEGRADRARGQRRLLARQAAVRTVTFRVVPDVVDPARRPAHRPRPTSSGQLSPDEALTVKKRAEAPGPRRADRAHRLPVRQCASPARRRTSGSAARSRTPSTARP